MKFKVGELYRQPYLNTVIKILFIDDKYDIMTVEYITSEYLISGATQKVHMTSPFVKGLKLEKVYNTTLYKTLMGTNND